MLPDVGKHSKPVFFSAAPVRGMEGSRQKAFKLQNHIPCFVIPRRFATKGTSYQTELTIQWKLQNWRCQSFSSEASSCLEPCGICSSFPHLRGPSICHSLRPVIINPLKRKQKPSPPQYTGTKRQSGESLQRGDNDERYIWGWKEFAMRKVSPQTRITEFKGLKCFEWINRHTVLPLYYGIMAYVSFTLCVELQLKTYIYS